MNERQGFRLRGYANLCREFIDKAAPLVTEVYQRNEDHESNPVMIQNFRFAFQAFNYCAKDTTLEILYLMTPFAFPKAIIAAGQDKAAVRFADNLARRLTGTGAYSIDHIVRMMPRELRSDEGLEYASRKKLAGLAKLITRALK